MKLGVFLEDELSISPGSVKLSIKSQLEKYRDKYDILTKTKKIPVEIYRIMPSKKVIVWFKIPSQSLKNFHYDVMLQLEPTNDASTFEECDVKFFSNSPSFVYGGYAYIFYHLDADPREPGKGMMIDQFRQKIPRDNLLIPKTAESLGKDAVSEEPVIRNRLGIPMPDFSIYCAIFYMLDNMSFRQVFDTRNYRTVNQLLTSIKSFDVLMLERKRMADKERKAKAKENRDNDKAVRSAVRAHSAGTAVKSPRGVSSIKRINKPKSNRGKTGGVNKIG